MGKLLGAWLVTVTEEVLAMLKTFIPGFCSGVLRFRFIDKEYHIFIKVVHLLRSYAF
jgi:hypothetical protein